MNHKVYISLIVGAVFSCLGLYLAFRNVPIASLLDYAAQINYAFAIFPVILAGWMSCLILGFRWQTLTKRDPF